MRYFRQRLAGFILSGRSLKIKHRLAGNYLTDPLEAINSNWERGRDVFSFYRWLAKQNKLPNRFESLEEFDSLFPVIDRNILRGWIEGVQAEAKSDRRVSTSGSTGQPMIFPVSRYDALQSYIDVYCYRRMYKFVPGSRVFMLWGHSHLFGTGLKGRIRHVTRNVQDFLINTKRVSCYDLNNQNIKEYTDQILRDQPEYLITYSSTLVLLASHIKNFSLSFDFLLGVVATSENLSQANKKMIEDSLKCPVILEYGIAELGLIAHNVPGRDSYEVNRNSVVVTTDDSSSIFVTSRRPHCFPFFKYDTGDSFVSGDFLESEIVGFKEVAGRSNIEVKFPLKDGSWLPKSRIILDHLTKNYAGVVSVRSSNLGNHLILTLIVTDVNCVIKENFLNDIIGINEEIDPNKIEIIQTKLFSRAKSGKIML